MYIDKFTALVKDSFGKKLKRIKIDADDVYSAHKLALEQCNELTQDITRIIDGEGNTVYTLDKGFVY